MNHTVICQEWLESERGWGKRPDGVSLHLTEADREAYCRQFWQAQKGKYPEGHVPDRYSRTSGEPYSIEINAATYARILASVPGLRLYEEELDHEPHLLRKDPT